MRVIVERHLDDHVLRAAVMIRHETSGAFVRPFDGTSQHARSVQEADIFWIDCGLHPERSADLAGDDANLVGRRTEYLHQGRLHAVHALAR